MKKYLSHGMGVNSTALMLLLDDEGIEFENVFVDHGGDYPETYEYVKYLKDKGFEITVITPDVEGCKTIEEYCWKCRIIPRIWRRWCSDKFKVRPFGKYVDKPCVCYIGFGIDEEKRSLNLKARKEITNNYPLIEHKIDREGCIKIIKEHNLRVPRRSGCWLCPFMRKGEMRQLLLNYPILYERRKYLEKNCQRNEGFYFSNKPLEVIAMENTPPIQRWL